MGNKFKPQVKNANKHTSYGLRLLEESVQKDGWVDAQTAAADGEIISGSARLELAAEKFAGVEPIIVDSDGTRPVIIRRTDIPNAENARARRLSVAANRIQAVDFDPDWALLKEWGGEDEQIKKLFSDDEWREGTGEEKPVADAEPQIDRAAELKVKWQTETGQLWKLGEHTLYCGDFRDADLMGESLVFDPPWDIEINFDYAMYKNILAFSDGQRVGDVINRFGSPSWLFIWHTGANWYTPNRPLKGHKNCLWYGKVESYNWVGSFYGDAGKSKIVTNTRGTYLYTPDSRGKHLADLFLSSITAEHEGHSHSKPLDWIRMLIANCTSGDIVDPFCGTGTSIIAAQQLGRRCRAAEIDPFQCALILERAELFGIREITRYFEKRASDSGSLLEGTVEDHA